MRRILAAAICVAWLAAGTAMARSIVTLAWEDEGEAAILHLPPDEHPVPPVIIILPDEMQRDLRAERYMEHLLASGFAVLVGQSEPVRAGWLVDRARRSPVLDGGRIGLLAFGAGAEAAMSAGRLPRALLYPGCGSLPAPPDAAPLLLLHGDADPANPPLACAATVQAWEDHGAPVQRHVLAGAGYAWDLEPLSGFRQALLPAPGLARRVRVIPDPWVTEQAADLVAQFFRELLGEDGQ